MRLKSSVLFGALALAALRGSLFAAAAYRVKLPDKVPLFAKVLDDADVSQPLSLKEPLLYLGFTVTWRPGAKVADVELNGAKAMLMLGEPWAYLDKGRLTLSSAPRWKDGRLLLGKDALEKVIQSLSPTAPSFETATAQELTSVDVQPTKEASPAAETAAPVATPASRPASSMAQSRGNYLNCVVIDAGHGGHDPGAHGQDGLEEKNTCLDIALRLRRVIQTRWPKVQVILTRSSDKFVTLRNRTIIANDAKADAFISIHNNASPSTKGRGSQVFFYDSGSSDRAAEDLARRENEDANYLEIMMADLRKEQVRDPSIMLAQDVQDKLSKDLVGIHSRKLHYAPFYVLARTLMPAILVEVAFISNPKEEALLGSASFRQQVAEGILHGLESYKAELAKL